MLIKCHTLTSVRKLSKATYTFCTSLPENTTGYKFVVSLNDTTRKMAFTFAAFCYILALILTAFLIFFVIYQIISFDELKTDYKNPIDQCRSLNPLVLPEYGLHGLFVVLFMFAFEWLTVIINMPLLAYHIYRYSHRPIMSCPGLYDPTTIMNSDELNRGMKEGWIKLAFYIISFFYYLYSMIYVLISA